MAITNGYATVAELQRKLGRTVSSSDTIFTFLEECIERASRAIDDLTGSVYYEASITSEKIDQFEVSNSGIIISCSDKIMFPAPLISVTSIVEDGVTLTSDDYWPYYSAGVITRPGGWTYTRQGILFTGSFGYSSYPKNVNSWCLAIAGALSGRETSTYTDDEGNIQEVIRNSVPKWVYDEIRANRKIMMV